MKRILFLLAVIVVIALIGGPVERALNDEEPIAESSQRLIPVDLPAPELPIAEAVPDPEAPPTPPATPAPLASQLVTVTASRVQVPKGVLKLNAGVPVTLVRDRGNQVEVRWGSEQVVVPRSAVQNSNAPPAAPRITPAPSSLPLPIAKATESLLQAPVDRVAVSAHEVGTSKGLDRTWTTDYGSYSRDSYRSKALEIEVRNVSRRPTGDCQVMVYWMGRNVESKDLVVHHAEMIPTNVAPATNTKVRFWCPLMAASDTKYVMLGIREQSGSKMDGWFVLVSRNGHTLGGVASSPTYERLLNSPAELGPLLASYKPSGRQATEAMPKWRTDPLRDETRSKRGQPTSTSQ